MANNVCKREFKPGDIVQHFKRVCNGKDEFPGTKKYWYKIIGVARSTVDLEHFVVYQALYDDCDLWIRPVKEFMSEVDKDMWPHCGQDFRFIKVQDGTEADNK